MPESNLSAIHAASIELRIGETFQDLVKEQNYKPITYQQFREDAKEINWSYSLGELLAVVD